MQFFNSIYSLHLFNVCFTVNINENKTGVITQIIPRYISEYYGNLDYNYQMQKMLDKARIGYIPQVRANRGTGLKILLGLNRVILNSELEGDGYIRCAYQPSQDM